LLLNDDLSEIIVNFIVDGDDLLSNSDDLLEGIVEADGFIGIIRDDEHLEGLVEFTVVFKGNQQIQCSEAVVQHFEKRGVAFQ
jgi:hypothetical protein